MRRLALLCPPFVLLVGACLPESREAAVRVDVTYTFKAGCITVRAQDAEASEREASTALEVLDRGPSTVTLAVFRQEAWSHTLEITTAAHERSCAGPVVAQQVHTIALREPRIEPLAVTLDAEDTDGDTYVATSGGGTDCDDSKDTIHPGVSTGVAEDLCNDVDDDCDGVVDEGFAAKGSDCNEPCPGGRYVCNATYTGLACGNAPTPLPVFPDEDGDGAGEEGASSSGSICPGAPPPAGTAINTDDCDDQDPHNRRGQAESCDARDNTCNTEVDEGGVCAGKGWKVVEDPALTGSRQWKTVALGTGGLPVWVAGSDGKLAVRRAAGQPFTSLDGDCGNYNWISAWVRPDDGTVFLGSAEGRVALHDGTACSNPGLNNPGQPITGLVGFQAGASTTLYLVLTLGRLSTWAPGNNPVEQYNLTPETYMGIHGLQSSLLLGVGGTENNPSVPSVSSYSGTGNTPQLHTLQGVPGGYNGSLRAVWMGSPKLAYAVGDGGLVMKWDGTTTWTRMLPPSDNATASFTSVVVLDSSSIYSTDASGVLRRLSASGWAASPLYSSGVPLRDLAASSPGDLWAVGDNGTVVHFPE